MKRVMWSGVGSSGNSSSGSMEATQNAPRKLEPGIPKIRLSLAVKILQILVIACICLLVTGCSGGSRDEADFQRLDDYDPQISYYPGERWAKLASPALAGWSIVELELARQYAESIHSSAVVIVDNGVIVAAWGDVAARFRLHSVRKSLMSVMYGIAVAGGQIDLQNTLEELSIDDIGGLSAVEKQATIHDLLTARSGVYHPAAYETAKMRQKRPPRGAHPPGSFWYYNNWDFNVLVTIFNQQTGGDFFTRFNEEIARPLQMEQFRLEDTLYHYDSEYSAHPAYRFRMSGLDLARFGLLCLRGGRWQDRQIVPADWLQQSTELYTSFDEKHPERGYGYLWWLDGDIYYAAGTGGQRLFIVPSHDLVIVHRVDTDSSVRIKSRRIWKLFDMIIQAKSASSTLDNGTANETSATGDSPSLDE